MALLLCLLGCMPAGSLRPTTATPTAIASNEPVTGNPATATNFVPELTQTPAKAAATAVPTAKVCGRVLAMEALNLRNGPGESFSLVDARVVLPSGAQLVVLEKNGSWANVVYGDRVGWARIEYIQIISCQ